MKWNNTLLSCLLYLKLNPPSAAALQGRSHRVDILSPKREELLYAQRSRRVITDVADTVFLTLTHQTGVHMKGELGKTYMISPHRKEETVVKQCK